MSRRNNKNKIKISPFSPQISPNKKRYSSKFEAENSAQYQMSLQPELKLKVYQDINGGWYLTRKNR